MFTIIWLMVLTVGTIDQKNMDYLQHKTNIFQYNYCFSYFLFEWINNIILSMNLFSFLKPNIWNKKKLGVLTVHMGALILLIGALLLAF